MERENKLAVLYRQSLQAIESQNWQEAQNLLVQIKSLDPTYRDALKLLEKVQAEIRRPQAAGQAPTPPGQKNGAIPPRQFRTYWIVGVFCFIGLLTVICFITLLWQLGGFSRFVMNMVSHQH